MKRAYWLPSVAAVVAVVLIGGAFALRERHPGTSAATVVDLRPAEVRHLIAQSDGEQVELYRRSGDWRPSSGTRRQSANLMFSFEDRLLPLRAYRALDVDPADPQFGLMEPEILVTIEDRTGEVRKVVLGAPSFTGAGYYAGVIGDPEAPLPRRVYLVTRRAMDDFRSLLEGQIIDSSEFFEDKLDALQAEATQAEPGAEMGPWVQQALEDGGQLPTGLK